MIPELVHQIWLGNKPEPTPWLRTWEEKSECRHLLWTDANLHSFITILDRPFGLCKGHLNMQADVARIELLYRYGGIYADADIICFHNLKALLSYDRAILFYENEKHTPGLISNAIIIAHRQEPLLACLIERIQDLKKPRLKTFASGATGPKWLTRTLKDLPKRVQPLILPSIYFFPEWCDTKIRDPKAKDYPNSLGFHLWANSNKLWQK